MTMLDYIEKAPELMAQRLEDTTWYEPLHALLAGATGKIVFVASGSSCNAASCAAAHLKRVFGKEIEIIPPFTFVHYEQPSPENTYILISQSGISMNTLAAADLLREHRCKFHLITDNRELCPNQWMSVSYLDVHDEQVPFVTLGFDLTVWLLLLAAGDDKQSYRLIPAYMRKSMALAREYHARNREWLKQVKRVHICGGGTAKFAATEGALKFCETMQIAASPYETEEFMHGGFLELERDHAVYLISTSEVRSRSMQSEDNLPMLTDHVFLIPGVPDLPEDLQALCVVPFFQTLVALMNQDRGNSVPRMKDIYIAFEKKLKSKQRAYYEETSK